MFQIRRRLGGMVVLPVSLLLMAAGMHLQETYRVSGDQVAIYNLAGEVEVVRGSGSDVVVHVSRGGGDADRLTVETGRADGMETLRILYPDDAVVYPGMGRNSNTTLRVRRDGTFGSGGKRVRVQGSGRGLRAWADLVVEVPAGTDIAVYQAVGEIRAEGVDGRVRLDTHNGAVSARSIRGDLTVDTGSGSVRVEDVEGDVLVDTGSGGVDVFNAAGSRLVVDTGSGSVEGANLSFASLSVDTGSGSVELEDVDARNVLVDTGSGSVELDLLGDVDDLEVDTGSGAITVRVPDALGARVELDTGSGGVRVDVPLEVERMGRDYAEGTLGDGQGRIVLDAGSGGIRLLRR